MTIILSCDTIDCDATINLRAYRVFKHDELEKKVGWMSKPGQRHFCKRCTTIYRGIENAELEGKLEEDMSTKKIKEDIKQPEVPTLEFVDEPHDFGKLGNDIVELLRGVNGRGMSPKEIERALDCDYRSMYDTLQYLKDHEIVENYKRGMWRYVR